jgi:predicted nucleotidyltransferase
MTNLKSLRLEKKLTQVEVAKLVGISLRSYKTYENDYTKIGTVKYNYIFEKLSKINQIDEEHGIVDLDYIKTKINPILSKNNIEFCILFGSYARKTATESSDIDLLVCGNISGLKFYGMVEELRTTLHKQVDVLDINQLNNNLDLTKEILKDGIRIYD